MIPLRTHPNRQYNLYLVHYYAHQARRRLEHLIATHGSQLPPSIRKELSAISGSIRLLGTLEPRTEEEKK